METNALSPEVVQQAQQLPENKRKKEYISGGNERVISPLLENAIRVMDQKPDDLSKEFGDNIYEEMSRDPAVYACVETLKSLVLASGIRVAPCVKDKKSPEYPKALEISDMVTRSLAKMQRSASMIVYEMMEAFDYGSAVAEIVYQVVYDPELKRPIYTLKDIKTKSRKFYNFVSDKFMNVLGIVNIEAGHSAGIYTGATQIEADKIVPRNKLVILTIQSKTADPRGRSILRSAWNPYYVKTQVWPQYLKFLVQFASPSVVGYTSPDDPENVDAVDQNDVPVIDPKTGLPLEVSAVSDLLASLLNFQNGTALALRSGAKVDILWSNGTGEAFIKGLELLDRQIAMSILKSYRTLLESQHSSKADSESSQDITDVYVGFLQDVISDTLTRDVAKQLVILNYGEADAEKFTPEITLKALPKQDFSRSASAISSLWTAGYIDESQIEDIDQMIGLPERDMESFASKLNQEAEMKNLDVLERMKLMNPGAASNNVPGDTSGQASFPNPKSN